MSQLESFSKKLQLQGLKHPWQPDWVKTKADVEVLFKYLDHFRYLVEEEMDWYPPFIVTEMFFFILFKNIGITAE